MNLFVFGLGYSAGVFVHEYGGRFTRVNATIRAPRDSIAGVRLHPFDDGTLDPAALNELRLATHILVSIPPDAAGDPVLRACGGIIESARACRWIGYLSSVAVYGDHDGQWIGEDAALAATSPRGRQRIAAEAAWLQCGARAGAVTQIFRLAGIYGPGRNALVNLRAGKAQRIVKAGQIFNRIHVADIARILIAAIEREGGSAAWNIADDEPAPPQDVIVFAAGLLGLSAPPEIPFEEAQLSPMATSFYADSKRVRNARVKADLGVTLAYPTYREGLSALAAAGEGATPARRSN